MIPCCCCTSSCSSARARVNWSKKLLITSNCWIHLQLSKSLSTSQITISPWSRVLCKLFCCYLLCFLHSPCDSSTFATKLNMSSPEDIVTVEKRWGISQGSLIHLNNRLKDLDANHNSDCANMFITVHQMLKKVETIDAELRDLTWPWLTCLTQTKTQAKSKKC